MQLCSSLSILWHWLSFGLQRKLMFSSPVASVEFSKFSLQLKTSLLTHHILSSTSWGKNIGGKNPPISRHMQFKPELFKAQVYTDAYNQSTKWQRCRRPQEQSELWLSLENSLCFASLFLLMSVLFFLVSLVLPTVPWHRQLWIHILELTIWWIQVSHIRFTTSGAKGTS